MSRTAIKRAHLFVALVLLVSCGFDSSSESDQVLPTLSPDMAYFRSIQNGKQNLASLETKNERTLEDTVVEWVTLVRSVAEDKDSRYLCRFTTQLNVDCISKPTGKLYSNWRLQRTLMVLESNIRIALYNPLTWDTIFAIDVPSTFPGNLALVPTKNNEFLYISSMGIYLIDSLGYKNVWNASNSHVGFSAIWNNGKNQLCRIQTIPAGDDFAQSKKMMCFDQSGALSDSAEFPLESLPVEHEIYGLFRLDYYDTPREWNSRIWFTYAVGGLLFANRSPYYDTIQVSLASMNFDGSDIQIARPYISDSTDHWDIHDTYFVPIDSESGILLVMEVRNDDYVSDVNLVVLRANSKGELTRLNRYDIESESISIDRAWVVDSKRFAVVLGGNLFLFGMDGKVIK